MGEVLIGLACLGFGALILFYIPITVAIVARGAARTTDADSRLLEAKNEARRLALEERKAGRAALSHKEGDRG